MQVHLPLRSFPLIVLISLRIRKATLNQIKSYSKNTPYTTWYLVIKMQLRLFSSFHIIEYFKTFAKQ